MRKEGFRYLFDREKDNTDCLSSLAYCELVKILLLNRDIKNAADADAFLSSGMFLWHDPFLMKDMDAACARIKLALERNERIAVYGDYDVDGVTATSVLINYLLDKGADTEYYIPQRCDEGYGLNTCAITALRNNGASLLITVDSGITGFEEVAHAKNLGIDTIITDHHECGASLPDAAAVLNPKRPDCPYPFKELAGVGVVFKLICALEGRDRLESMFSRYGELVALGTIADVMPLIGENRLIAKEGLLRLQNTQNNGIRALIDKSGLNGRPISAVTVSFMLAPRINAAGRVGNANLAAELFITDDKNRADEIAQWLCEKNRERQETEAEILRQVNILLDGEDTRGGRIIVLDSENWHQGVIGIVASKVCERCSCPTILISTEEEPAKGSGRSIAGFNLFKALELTSEYLEKYGGHELAAGLSIKKENIAAFRDEINEKFKFEFQNLEPPGLQAECEIYPDDVSAETIREISRLEPFGMGNQTPLFYMRNVLVVDIFPISDNKHVKMNLLLEKDKAVTGLCFNTPEEKVGVTHGDRVDIIFEMNLNRFRDKETIQFIIKSLMLSKQYGGRIHTCKDIYTKHCRNEPLLRHELETMIPVRDDFVATYRYLCTNSRRGTGIFDITLLARQISWHSKIEVNHAKVMICLEVMQENELITYSKNDGMVSVDIIKNAPKVNLNDSFILKRLKEAYERVT